MSTNTKTGRQYVPRFGTKVRRHVSLCGEVNDVVSALGRFSDAVEDFANDPTPANKKRMADLAQEVLAETLDCTEQATGINTMTLGTGTKELKN